MNKDRQPQTEPCSTKDNILAGIAIIGLGITVLTPKSGLSKRLRGWVAALTRDPDGGETSEKDQHRVGGPSGT